MREYKFRAWDGEKIIYQDNNGFFDKVKIDRYPTLQTIQFHSASIYCKIMQFTGLKDRHGKEIYDGDIITNHDFESNLLIGFSSDKCAFVGSKTTSFNIEDIYNFFDDIVFEDKWEVIGNIYENPELLK